MRYYEKLDYHFGIKKQLKWRTAKKLTPLVKHLLLPKIIVEAVIIVLVLCAGVSALVIQHNHNKPTPITTSPTSSTDGNSCLLSNSGCSDSDKPSTPTATTQTPANIHSTPATTSTPSTQTQPTYPSESDGLVSTSSTCHYPVGYGEAYYRDQLVQDIQTQQNGIESSINNDVYDYNEYGLETSQQALNAVNQLITGLNNYIDTTYSQYESDVNSIGCATTIDTTNIPQVPVCTELNDEACFNSVLNLSLPSLED